MPVALLPPVRPGSRVPSRRRLPDVVRSRRDLEGELTRVRRGVYRPSDAPGDPHGAALRRESLVLARMAAERHARSGEFWFSHTSAALLWGCWTWRLADEVHTIQTDPPDVPRFDRTVRRHWTKDLLRRDVTLLDGVPVTSLERTTVDCARLLPPDQAVVVADSAVRIGADPDGLARAVREAVGKRGVRSARRVLDVADGVVESPGESLVRWFVVDGGLAPPAAAVPVTTWSGTRWVDLGWPELKVGLEFDGALKYRAAGSSGREALLAEKARQDALTEAGWFLVRITWADLFDPALLLARVRAALSGRS